MTSKYGNMISTNGVIKHICFLRWKSNLFVVVSADCDSKCSGWQLTLFKIAAQWTAGEKSVASIYNFALLHIFGRICKFTYMFVFERDKSNLSVLHTLEVNGQFRLLLTRSMLSIFRFASVFGCLILSVLSTIQEYTISAGRILLYMVSIQEINIL